MGERVALATPTCATGLDVGMLSSTLAAYLGTKPPQIRPELAVVRLLREAGLEFRAEAGARAEDLEADHYHRR